MLTKCLIDLALFKLVLALNLNIHLQFGEHKRDFFLLGGFGGIPRSLPYLIEKIRRTLYFLDFDFDLDFDRK